MGPVQAAKFPAFNGTEEYGHPFLRNYNNYFYYEALQCLKEATKENAKSGAGKSLLYDIGSKLPKTAEYWDLKDIVAIRAPINEYDRKFLNRDKN